MMDTTMTDYGHDLLFGAFITPTATPATQAVDLAVVADHAGLDLVTFQDHPYQPGFHDTWTLLSFAASRTERVRLSGNVLNLPLRDPAVMARTVAIFEQDGSDAWWTRPASDFLGPDYRPEDYVERRFPPDGAGAPVLPTPPLCTHGVKDQKSVDVLRPYIS